MPRSRLAALATSAAALAVFLAPAPGVADPITPEPVALDYYLPAATEYDPAIPTPQSVLGFGVGEWHVRHDQLVRYMETLAAASERVEIETTGLTYERRPLVVLTISSPANLARREAIQRARHRLTVEPARDDDGAPEPVVVYLGYSVHGNEASGSNAALVVAYHLAAARGAAVDRLLDEAVILLDPSLNPDGMARFATWANAHRGQVPVADPEHREHREGWPNGRTNHYWFDLNRDWLMAVHPESRARLAVFDRWRPNVLGDFHEMGTESTYFFQPGVPSRKHPLTPTENVELTGRLTGHVARALDEIGSLYFTEEVFDDFYYGKGSTYPDVRGAVGVLFEQASARGHVQEASLGTVTFPFAIRNHVRSSLALLAGAVDARRALVDYQRTFYERAVEEPEESLHAWVVGDGGDPARFHELLDLLHLHDVAVHDLGEEVTLGGETFVPGHAVAVPLAQPEGRLVRALFERRVDFADPVFYDVSAWTLPLAFGLPSAPVESRGFLTGLGDARDAPAPPRGTMSGDRDAYAYAFAWDGFWAPRALARLLRAGVAATAATEPVTLRTTAGPRELGRGAIVVPMGVQTLDREAVLALLATAAAEDAVDVHALGSGLTATGVDLGSPKLVPVEMPTPALLVGGGVSTYDAGELWHLLDHRYHVPLTHLETDRLGDAELHRYSHLFVPDGSYGDLGDEVVERLGRWIAEDGGVLVAQQRAAVWAGETFLAPRDDDEDDGGDADEEGDEDDVDGEEDEAPERLAYADREREAALDLISGTIFGVDLDTTHPLAFGYTRPELAVFRTSRTALEAPTDDPFATVARYVDAPLLAGYVSGENLGRLAGTPAIVARRLGRGLVVQIADDLDFRAFWLGTHKILANALFFGPLVEDTRRRPSDE